MMCAKTLQSSVRCKMTVVVWMLFGIGAAIAASNKGRSVFGWFLLGVLLGPFGLLFVLLLPKTGKKVNPDYVRPGGVIEVPDMKICPMCAEEIKRAAVKCKHCGHGFDAAQVANDEDLLTDPTYCPRCRNHDVVQAFLGDGSYGPFCPNCKAAVK